MRRFNIISTKLLFQVPVPLKVYLNKPLWFNHAGCLKDWERDMNKWVIWIYVEPFTLFLNRDKGRHLLSPIVLVPVPNTANVIIPLRLRRNNNLLWQVENCNQFSTETLRMFEPFWEHDDLSDELVVRFSHSNGSEQLLQVVRKLGSPTVPFSSWVHGDEYTGVGININL